MTTGPCFYDVSKSIHPRGYTEAGADRMVDPRF